MAQDPSFKGDVVRQLADILNDTHLTEIEYEVEGCKIRVARQLTVNASSYIPQSSMPVVDVAVPLSASALTPTATSSKFSSNPIDYHDMPGAVKAPMVGTAYMSASPGSAAFITVGDSVTKGQTLLIIEAMKMMNQIKSPQDGVVKHIFIKNNDPIEYDQVLVVIES